MLHGYYFGFCSYEWILTDVRSPFAWNLKKLNLNMNKGEISLRAD